MYTYRYMYIYIHTFTLPQVFPGDTDLRAVRDFGGIDGLDLIFVENGYAYHTSQDETHQISANDLARAGE